MESAPEPLGRRWGVRLRLFCVNEVHSPCGVPPPPNSDRSLVFCRLDGLVCHKVLITETLLGKLLFLNNLAPEKSPGLLLALIYIFSIADGG